MLDLFTRKNFPEKIKLKIIKKASICQMCKLQTDCGECAHIVAAGKNGPRNKHQLVQEHIIPDDYDVNTDENGLYLCTNCHTMIDRNPNKYSYQYLTQIKNNKIDATKTIKSSGETLTCPNISHQEESIHEDIVCITSMNCDLCGKSFTSKYSLEYHINHNVCTKHNVKCSKCGKALSSTSLPYHLKNNVCAKQKEKFMLKLKTKQAYDHMSKDEIINQLEHELSKMVGKYESLKENPQNINKINDGDFELDTTNKTAH